MTESNYWVFYLFCSNRPLMWTVKLLKPQIFDFHKLQGEMPDFSAVKCLTFVSSEALTSFFCQMLRNKVDGSSEKTQRSELKNAEKRVEGNYVGDYSLWRQHKHSFHIESSRLSYYTPSWGDSECFYMMSWRLSAVVDGYFILGQGGELTH